MREVDQLMGTRAVCAALGGIHRVTLSKWVNCGRFPPPLQDGTRNYWRASQIEKHISKLQPGATRTLPVNARAGAAKVAR